MSKHPELWTTRKGVISKVVPRSSRGQFAGPTLNPSTVFKVEVWSARQGPILKTVARSTNGRFM